MVHTIEGRHHILPCSIKCHNEHKWDSHDICRMLMGIYTIYMGWSPGSHPIEGKGGYTGPVALCYLAGNLINLRRA